MLEFMIDLFHIDDAFRDYITNRLLPLVEIPVSSCRVEIPLMGRKSCIRLVRGEGGKGYIVRAFRGRDLSMAYQLYRADDILEKNRIPAPRLVDFAEKYSRKGVTFIAEEYLSGEIWANLEMTDIPARNLGTILAKLHSVTSELWGSIDEGKRKREGFGRSQFRRVRHRLHRVRKFSPDTVTPAEFRAVREWFRGFFPRLDAISSFQLVHDKLNGGNILLSPGQDLFFLDFATLQYGYRGKDIAQAEILLLNKDKELVRAFREDYFSRFPEPVKEEYDNFSRFYRAYQHLSRSASNIRRDYESRTRNHQFKTDYYNRFLNHWRALWSIVEGTDDQK